jgi:hypothetical protein
MRGSLSVAEEVMSFSRACGSLICAAAIGTANLAHAITYDIANDFSITNNPNGVWSYGYENTLGGTLNLYDVKSTSNGIQYWNSSTVNVTGDPTVFYNPTNSSITVGSYTLPAHTNAFHEGSLDQYSVYEFTAPVAGSYTLASSYGRIDTGGTDVHVLLNGNTASQLFTTILAPGIKNADVYNTTLGLAAGDRVDFAVGWGPNQNYFFDSTAIRAAFTVSVPGPIAGAGIPGLLFAGGGLFAWARKRRKPLAC